MPVNNGFRANNQLDIPVGLFVLFRAFQKSGTHVLRFFHLFSNAHAPRPTPSPTATQHKSTQDQRTKDKLWPQLCPRPRKGRRAVFALCSQGTDSFLVFVHQIIVPVTDMSLLMLSLLLHSPPHRTKSSQMVRSKPIQHRLIEMLLVVLDGRFLRRTQPRCLRIPLHDAMLIVVKIDP